MHPAIASLYDKFGHLPAQGSAQWLANREGGLGGSELASVLGAGYNSRRELLRQKVGLTYVDPDNENFHWGHLFEPVHKQIAERAMGTSVHEFGSLPWGSHESGYGTSPDGVFVATRDQIARVLNEDDRALLQTAFPADREIMGVLELKAPARRAIDGNIPKYYIPQLYSEMCVVPGSECVVFSEAIFRRCTLAQYNDSPEFTNTFMQRGGDKYRGVSPVDRGLIYIYAQPADDFAKGAECMAEYVTQLRNLCCDQLDGAHIDFGAVDPEAFFTMIKYWYAGAFTAEYHFRGDDGDDSERAGLIGVVPWKLLRVDYHLRMKKPDYIDKCWPAISACLDVIRRLRTGDLSAEDKNAQIIRADIEINALLKKMRATYDFEV